MGLTGGWPSIESYPPLLFASCTSSIVTDDDSDVTFFMSSVRLSKLYSEGRQCFESSCE